MPPLPFYVSLENAEDPIQSLEKEFNLPSAEVSLARELVGLQLPPLVKPEILSFLFGISHDSILWMSKEEDVHYRVFSRPKSSGGTRQIEAPRRFLKLVQRWIYDHILSRREFSQAVHGFVPGKSIFSNAARHLPSKNLMVIDIEDFFPSVNQKQIYRIFKSFGFPYRVAHLLTGLCIFQSRLPQRAPTSPALANIAFSPTDRVLEELAAEWECVYSRYADDLAFSGNRVFSREDISSVEGILEHAGFRINRKKSRIIGGGGRQIVAGLVVNQSGFPPRYQRMKWRAMFHKAGLNPNAFLGRSSTLRGISAFVNEYDPIRASRYKAIAQRVADVERSST